MALFQKMQWIQERGTFHGGGEAHALHVGSEDNGHGVVGLGLQWIQEKNTISWWQQSPWTGSWI